MRAASAEYAAEFNEVKLLGSNANPNPRSDAQTLLAQFYSANPMPILNRAFRGIAADRGLSTLEQARLFAMMSMAGADSLIGCWDDKDHWNFWRPLTAIREAADDGNDATAADPDWRPFFGTPPYPDHPSGYNCYAAGVIHTAEAYFRTDHLGISLTSPNAPGTTLSYRRFSAVLKDTIDARIYMGIHFRNPDVQGAWLGKKVAKWVEKHYFEAVD